MGDNEVASRLGRGLKIELVEVDEGGRAATLAGKCSTKLSLLLLPLPYSFYGMEVRVYHSICMLPWEDRLSGSDTTTLIAWLWSVIDIPSLHLNGLEAGKGRVWGEMGWKVERRTSSPKAQILACGLRSTASQR